MTLPPNSQQQPITITDTRLATLRTYPLPESGLPLKPAPAVGGVTVMYPILLLFSTALAGVFCYLYLTKPVFAAPTTPPPRVVMVPALSPAAPAAALEAPAAAAPAVEPAPPIAALLPAADRLPGDAAAAALSPDPQAAVGGQTLPAAASPFEETNLQVQHILTAEAANGAISRIVLDVPVLYQTGQLAWTGNEVAEARNLLGSLAEHQENTRALREQGELLLAAWNSLVERSIPVASLRADSPALPANQQAGDAASPPPTLDTTESIQLKPLDP